MLFLFSIVKILGHLIKFLYKIMVSKPIVILNYSILPLKYWVIIPYSKLSDLIRDKDLASTRLADWNMTNTTM